MKCKLCLKEKSLCNSHVIPEFFYKSLYDNKHRFVSMSNVESKNNKIYQSGITEKLLCRSCEELIGVYENQVAPFFELFLKNVDLNKSEESFEIDYANFKLFELSIIWRASISSLPDFYNVQLGTEEEKIRKMLISSNPGKYHQFPCFLVLIKHKARVVSDLIIPSDKILIEDQKCFRLVFGGFQWTYFVSEGVKGSIYDTLFIKEDNILRIRITLLEKMQYILEFFKELQSQEKVNKAKRILIKK